MLRLYIQIVVLRKITVLLLLCCKYCDNPVQNKKIST